MMNTEEIVYIKAQDKQSALHLLGKDIPKIVNYPISLLAEFLVPAGFIRIHREYIINLRHLANFDIGKDGTVYLTNGIILPVSRNYIEELKAALKIAD